MLSDLQSRSEVAQRPEAAQQFLDAQDDSDHGFVSEAWEDLAAALAESEDLPLSTRSNAQPYPSARCQRRRGHHTTSFRGQSLGDLT
jgi:hypothetical protein